MAQRDYLQEKFSCCNCLNLLEDPVVFSCGQSYCRKCVKAHWDKEEKKLVYSCPQCRQTFKPRPSQVKNTTPAASVEEVKKSGVHADHSFARAEDVACDVCTGRKLRALKSCLVCQASSCESYLQPHRDAAPLNKHKLGEPSKEPQENISPRYHQSYLGSGTATAKGRDQLQDVLSEKFQNVSLTRSDNVLPSPEPRTREDFLRYLCKITLDPNTAHTHLLLSEGNRKATLMREEQAYSSHPDRFVRWRQVLSKESLTGQCYWEVEWKTKRVTVAVAYKNIGREGNITECAFGFSNMSWALECNSTRYKFIQNCIKTRISGPRSSRVGVYLDHGAGILSFYTITETMTLLHRVQTAFTQPLHAGVWFAGYPGAFAEFCKLTPEETGSV